jgi:hypothetical protein
VAKLLKEHGLLGGSAASFDFTTGPVQELPKDSVQFVDVSYGLEDVQNLDDMVAALGRFNLRINIAGSVSPTSPSRKVYKITIDRLAVYVDDSFDVNGFQFLGYWSVFKNSASASLFASGAAVTNTLYREWGERHNRGGDFKVFSDVKKQTLRRPIEMRCLVDKQGVARNCY